MELVCILCPKGCHLTIEKDEHGEWTIEGNDCSRGEAYAIQEAECPMRTLTTSIWVEDGDYRLVSIKTDQSIPKDKIPQALQEAAGIHVCAPVKMGQILRRGVAGTQANFVASRQVKKS